MPKFAANLSFLFTEHPFLERFQRAAQAGFSGVEYLFPYEWPAAQLAGLLEAAGLEQVLFNLPPGNWAAGDRGMACHPGRQGEFRDGLMLALEYADRLGCKRLHAMAGLAVPGVSEAEQEAIFLENVCTAAALCESAKVTLMIEPINRLIDMPGYWLDHPDKAFRLQKQVNHPSVKVLLDLYHAQVVGVDLLQILTEEMPQIGHLQLADFPGRQEPGTGLIDFPALFKRIDALAYSGWIGCEYRPAQENTETSLAWFQPFRSNGC